MSDALTVALWMFGSLLSLLASIGVLRLPDVFCRMHASTKASSLGLGCLLLGTALQFGDLTSLVRTVSIGAFIFLTSPISAHVIARAAYLSEVKLWGGTLLDERKDAATPTPHGSSPGDAPPAPSADHAAP